MELRCHFFKKCSRYIYFFVEEKIELTFLSISVAKISF